MRTLAGTVLIAAAEQAFAHALMVRFPNHLFAREVLLPSSAVLLFLGLSLLVWGILPYVDLATVYEGLTMDGAHPGWTHGGSANSAGRRNANFIAGQYYPIMRCPSTPLQKFHDTGAARLCHVNYVGIEGAANGDGWTNNSNHGQFTPAGGLRAMGGALIYGDAISFARIIDGTSNTLLVSEQSDFGWDAGDGQFKRINAEHGWLMGAPNRNDRHFNLTTLRYPINSANADGVGTSLGGIHNNDGPNNGIFSPHIGGAHGLLCDGAVVFLNENMDMRTLRLLSTRDDNQELGDF